MDASSAPHFFDLLRPRPRPRSATCPIVREPAWHRLQRKRRTRARGVLRSFVEGLPTPKIRVLQALAALSGHHSKPSIVFQAQAKLAGNMASPWRCGPPTRRPPTFVRDVAKVGRSCVEDSRLLTRERSGQAAGIKARADGVLRRPGHSRHHQEAEDPNLHEAKEKASSRASTREGQAGQGWSSTYSSAQPRSASQSSASTCSGPTGPTETGDGHFGKRRRQEATRLLGPACQAGRPASVCIGPHEQGHWELSAGGNQSSTQTGEAPVYSLDNAGAVTTGKGPPVVLRGLLGFVQRKLAPVAGAIQDEARDFGKTGQGAAGMDRAAAYSIRTDQEGDFGKAPTPRISKVLARRRWTRMSRMRRRVQLDRSRSDSRLRGNMLKS